MDLTLVTGPMFAGKTSYLINAIKNTECKSTIIATHHTDIRFSKGDELINHDGECLKHSVLRIDSLSKMPDIDKDASILIAIDEAQFFEDIVGYVRDKWENGYKNLKIILCGLNGDFRQTPFGKEPNWISKLISIASNVHYLKARCWKCGEPACFSIRKPNTDSKSTFLVGGADIYTAACFKHCKGCDDDDDVSIAATGGGDQEE